MYHILENNKQVLVLERMRISTYGYSVAVLLFTAR